MKPASKRSIYAGGIRAQGNFRITVPENTLMNIGQAAKQTGLSTKMLRHYEVIGLLKNATRSDAGYRLYTESDLHVLHFIKRARSLGFSLEQIKVLLSLWQDRKRASKDVKALAQKHIEELTEKIRELSDMREVLENLAQHCSGDQRPDCPILSNLAEPQHLHANAAVPGSHGAPRHKQHEQ